MLDLYRYSLVTILVVGSATIFAAIEIGWQLGTRAGRRGVRDNTASITSAIPENGSLRSKNASTATSSAA